MVTERASWAARVWLAALLALGSGCSRVPENRPDPAPPGADAKAIPAEAKAPEQLPPLIPGTKVRLAPPPGFTPAGTFAGYQHDATHASVLVVELPGPFDEVVAGFKDEDKLRQQGMLVLEATDLEHAAHPGLLLHVEQVARGITVEKWVWAFGDGNASVLVMGTCFEAHCPEQLDALRASVTSAVWDPAAAPDPMAELGFSVGDMGGLRFATRLANLLMYTDSGEVEIDPENGVSFMIGPALGSGPIADRSAFAEQRTRALPLDDLKLEKTAPVAIDGLDGYQLTGTFKRKVRFDHVAYVAIVFEDNNYWMAVGTAPANQRVKYLKLFRELAATLRRDR